MLQLDYTKVGLLVQIFSLLIIGPSQVSYLSKHIWILFLCKSQGGAKPQYSGYTSNTGQKDYL